MWVSAGAYHPLRRASRHGPGWVKGSVPRGSALAPPTTGAAHPVSTRSADAEPRPHAERGAFASPSSRLDLVPAAPGRLDMRTAEGTGGEGGGEGLGRPKTGTRGQCAERGSGARGAGGVRPAPARGREGSAGRTPTEDAPRPGRPRGAPGRAWRPSPTGRRARGNSVLSAASRSPSGPRLQTRGLQGAAAGRPRVPGPPGCCCGGGRSRVRLVRPQARQVPGLSRPHLA